MFSKFLESVFVRSCAFLLNVTVLIYIDLLLLLSQLFPFSGVWKTVRRFYSLAFLSYEYLVISCFIWFYLSCACSFWSSWRIVCVSLLFCFTLAFSVGMASGRSFRIFVFCICSFIACFCESGSGLQVSFLRCGFVVFVFLCSCCRKTCRKCRNMSSKWCAAKQHSCRW